MTVFYEWDCEHVTADEYEDIQEHQHTETYAEAVRFAAEPQEGCFTRVVLVRDDDDRRAWAYVEDGKLPEFFEDANGVEYRRVPKRFHAEVAKQEN